MLAIYIGVVVVLVLLNGWLALSEMAVVSSHRARLRERAERDLPGARTALYLARDPGRFLSTVQVGITLVGVVTGAFGGATLAAPLARWLAGFAPLAGFSSTLAFIVVVTATTYFTLIIGELVPKRLALRNPEWFAGLVARPMDALSRAARPLVWVLEVSTNGVLRCFGLHGQGGHGVTEEDVRTMIREGTREGVFDPREQAMIDGLLRLNDRSARSVMVPRHEVVWLDVEDNLATLRAKIESAGFSCLLVCRDNIDELVGVVRMHDILNLLMRGEEVDLARCIVEPVVVPDSTPVIDLLDRFKDAHAHLAVVVDEYGTLAGIATITDVLEVITGDLPEHWEQEPSHGAVACGEHTWDVDGLMAIDDFENALGLRGIAAGSRYETVAGFVLNQLESMPQPGERIDWHGVRFEVAVMDGQRISQLKVSLPE